MDEIGREREKKNFVPNSVHTRPGNKIPKKIAKKFKKSKNLFSAIFLAKTGSDRPREGEKNFRPEFRLYWAPGRKFGKK